MIQTSSHGISEAYKIDRAFFKPAERTENAAGKKKDSFVFFFAVEILLVVSLFVAAIFSYENLRLSSAEKRVETLKEIMESDNSRILDEWNNLNASD